TDLGVEIARVAYARGLGKIHDFVDELVVDGPLREQSRPGNASLAGRREDPGDDTLHRIVEIGIVENDIGRLPAELQSHALQAPRGELVHPLAALLASGERDLRDQWMRDQRL